MRPERPAVRPSFPARNHDSLIQASLFNGLTDPPEGFEPPLATLKLVKEVPDSLFDEFIGAILRIRHPRDCGGIEPSETSSDHL